MKTNHLMLQLIAAFLITSVSNVYAVDSTWVGTASNPSYHIQFQRGNLLSSSQALKNANVRRDIGNSKGSDASDEKGLKFSGNAELWILSGGGSSAMYYGPTVGVIKSISGGFSVGSSVGYVFRSEGGVTSSYIPILAKARYYVSKGTSGFYPEAALGVTSSSIKVGGISASATNFTFGAGIGYKLEKGLDFSGFYNNIAASGGSTNVFGFKVGYWF
jgi:hypothetical protein